MMNYHSKSASSPFQPFWYVNKKGELQIVQLWFIEFLQSQGFAKTYLKGHQISTLIRIRNNIVTEVTPEHVKDFVVDVLTNAAPDALEVFAESPYRHCSRDKLELLTNVELNILRDTKATCYLPYRNGVVKITAETLHLLAYPSIPGVVWEQSIIDREFKRSTESPVFAQFVRNICACDRSRIEALMSAFCYLIHDDKDPSLAKVVCLYDENAEDLNGGTGKGVFVKGIGQVRSVQTIDARTRAQNQFVFQGVRQSASVLHLEDIRVGFDIGQIFNAVTGDLEVENKGRNRFTISFEDAPKLVLSSNYVIDGYDVSHKRRMAEYELHNHYDHTFSPENEFGHLFFLEWDENEWARFDSWVCRVVAHYLKHGLVTVDPINLHFKRLVVKTCKTFATWLRDEFTVEPGIWYEKGKLAKAYNNYCDAAIDTRTVVKWLKEAATLFGLKCEENVQRVNGKPARMIRFVTVNPKDRKHAKQADLNLDHQLT